MGVAAAASLYTYIYVFFFVVFRNIFNGMSVASDLGNFKWAASEPSEPNVRWQIRELVEPESPSRRPVFEAHEARRMWAMAMEHSTHSIEYSTYIMMNGFQVERRPYCPDSESMLSVRLSVSCVGMRRASHIYVYINEYICMYIF